MKLLSFALFTLLLTACGGGSDTAEQDAELAGRSLNGSGQFLQPSANETFQSNLSFSIRAIDPDGIQQVSLQLGSGEIVLCDDCGGTEYETIKSGVNPGFYGLNPGVITVSLQLTDVLGNTQLVSQINLEWQPIVIADVAVNRTPGQVQINWTNDNQFLRYNLYLAAEPGVNRDTYQQLQQGQALLAITSGPQVFSGLIDAQQYHLLLIGVDGGGESSLPAETVILPLGNQANLAPIANDDAAVTAEDTAVTIAPLNNDTDPENDVLRVVAAQTNSGEVTFTDTQIELTPADNFFGDVVIQYSIQDIALNQANGQIVVTVTAVNDVPDLSNDTANTLVNTAVNVNVLANDVDVDADMLTVTDADADNGDTLIEADSTITYTPNTDFVGLDTLNYAVSDGNGGVAAAFVEITVALNNQAPVANDDTFDMFQNRTLTVPAVNGLLANDTDADSDQLTVDMQPLLAPVSGVLNLQEDGSFDYTPTPGFIGADGFTYQITDPGGATAQAQVTINVQAIPANLSGDSVTDNGELLYLGQGEDTPGSGLGTGLYRIGNCLQIVDTRCTTIGEYQERADSGNDPLATGTYAFVLSYSGVGDSPILARSVQPGGIVLNFVTTGDALFELFLFPDKGGKFRAEFPGDASLQAFSAPIEQPVTCTGLPQGQECNIGTVGLVPGAQLTAPLARLEFAISGLSTINDNAVPVATDDDFQVTAGQAFSVNAPGVLGNDTDADNPIVGDVLDIDLEIPANFAQAVSLAADQYRQLIYIYPAFFPTIHILDRQGQAINTLPWPGEGANDADVDIAPETFAMNGVNVPQGSVMAFNGETDEAEIYVLDPETGNQIAFLATAFGNSHVVGGAFNPVTDTIFLLQDNVPAGDNANRVAEIDPANGQVLQSFLLNDFNVSFGDLDINNETGTLYLVSSAETTMLELTTDGQFIRRLPLPDLMTNLSGLAINNESDRLWGINNSLQSPAYEVSYDNNGTFPALVATLITEPQNGVVELNLDGSFTYTPNAGFVGVDTFVYQVTDEDGQFSQGEVTLIVQ